jgi:superfamily II DNA or RNA helicase
VLELIYDNDFVTLSGEYDINTYNVINEECSYFNPESDWSEKFQTGVWDGKISLLRKKTKQFPAGLIFDVSKCLDKNNIPHRIIDRRKKPVVSKKTCVDFGERQLRDYQINSINAIKKNTRGILNLCTGAGKTILSCGIISELSVFPVVFIVPSVSLLKQTVAEFRQTLKPLSEDFHIGALGGGEFDIADNGVNVCTYQTLLNAYNKKYLTTKNKIVDYEDKTSLESLKQQLKILEVDLANTPEKKKKSVQTKITKVKTSIKGLEKTRENKKKIRELIERCQLLIIDETHLAAVIIELISTKANNAYYKCGLSATPMRGDNQEKRMFGATGPIIIKVSASDLIKRGFLVKPYIYMIDLDLPDQSQPLYFETYKQGVVLSQERNNLIRDYAVEMREAGRPTLIMIERLEHGEILQQLIPNSVFVPGGSGDNDEPIPDEELDYRRYQLNRLEKNQIIMIATSWSFTGVDAPKTSCLILGCSVASEVTVLQQIGRVLRKADGKEDCVIIDFINKEPHLRKHSVSRRKAYAKEQGFEVKIFKYNSKKSSYI